jgi:hypothetical protein
VYRFLLGKQKGKRPLGRPRQDGWKILEWICSESSVYSVLVGKMERKRPFWRPRRRFMDDISIGLWGEDRL